MPHNLVLEARHTASLQISLVLFSRQGFSPYQSTGYELVIVGEGMLQEMYQLVLHLVWLEAEIIYKFSLIQLDPRQKSIMDAGIC